MLFKSARKGKATLLSTLIEDFQLFTEWTAGDSASTMMMMQDKYIPADFGEADRAKARLATFLLLLVVVSRDIGMVKPCGG